MAISAWNFGKIKGIYRPGMHRHRSWGHWLDGYAITAETGMQHTGHIPK